MILKKLTLAASLAAGVALTPAAFAVDGTITFNGNVLATSCTINGGTADFTVTLPDVSTNTLQAAGDTAGQTAFNIALSGCSANATASAYFEQGAGIDATTGNLINAGTATNVQVQLVNSDGTSPINLMTPATNTTTAAVTTTTGGTLTYYARYYATGASTAGTVSAQEQYTINYN
jgi:major type 1 subunit fimbrin (pilin)